MQTIEQHNNLDTAAIHPARGAKFSPNLHKWLTWKKAPYRAWTSRVYRDSDGTLWIGRPDDGALIGARVATVLCGGTKAASMCWVNLRGLVEVADFWESYVRDGRCAIDTEHRLYFVGDDTRWTVDGDARACLWCGNARQMMRRWTEQVEHAAWANE